MMNNTIDLTECDREPIHIPGSIQPHGLFLGLIEPTLTIVHISDNIQNFFDVSVDDLLYRDLKDIITEQEWQTLQLKLAKFQAFENINPGYFTLQINQKKLLFEGVLHRSNGLLLLELEPYTLKLQQFQDSFYHLSKQSISRLQTIPIDSELTVLAEVAAEEVQKITGFDRVMIYQFDKDGHGAVIAEAKQASLEPYLGLHYPASDIPQQARALYLKNWLRLIPNVDYQPAVILPTRHAVTRSAIDLSQSILRSVSPIHLEYLRNMGVKASMSVSLIHNNQLWGLIACHHQTPKQLSYEVRTTCEFLGQILSWHISSKIAHLENNQLIQQNNQINALLKKISIADDWIKCSIQQAKRLLGFVGATGAVIFFNGKYNLIGKTPDVEDVKEIITQLNPKLQANEIFFTDSLVPIYPSASRFKDTASGVLALSLFQNNTDMILWFKPEILRTINWAGEPKKAVTQEEKRLTPRSSFAKWQEQKHYTSTPWTSVDVKVCREFKQIILEIIVKQEIKSKQAARQRQKEQEEFVDTICHEMRNPINGIVGNLDALKEQLHHLEESIAALSIIAQTKEQLQKQIRSMEEYIIDAEVCANHQTSVANDVLVLSKLTNKKLEILNEAYDINQTIRIVSRMVMHKVKEKSLNLELVLPEKSRVVKGDSFRLRQVLINLLTNAIKFTDQGLIRLSYQMLPNDMIEFSVSDTGIGLTEEEQAKLFQPFSQANKFISSQYGGTGLGLSISYKLVELMGGQIAVKSQKGLGTTFSFTISYQPLTLQEIKEFKPRVSTKLPMLAKTATVGNFKRILIVENNIINQKVLEKLLVKQGYSCEIANNGQEAVDLFQQQRFDAVFMDINMPIMGGYEATQQIRNYEKSTHLSPVPILCVSGNVRDIYAQTAIEAGMNDFIAKPFKAADIAEKLEHHFNKILSDDGSPPTIFKT